MIRVQNIQALFIKQTKDILKNTPVLVLFLVYPVIAFIMTNAMKDQVGSGSFFLSIFATMHCAFSPIVATTSILSEEKENNTLRVLIMSNVTLREYFVSIGGFILITTLVSGSTFLLIADKSPYDCLIFLAAMGIGSILSIILGTCIGLYAKNASAANGLAVPCGMFFAFLPMLAYFNKGIGSISKFTYGQQISNLFDKGEISIFGILVICCNAVVLGVLASILYKKSLAEE